MSESDGRTPTPLAVSPAPSEQITSYRPVDTAAIVDPGQPQSTAQAPSQISVSETTTSSMTMNSATPFSKKYNVPGIHQAEYLFQQFQSGKITFLYAASGLLQMLPDLSIPGSPGHEAYMEYLALLYENSLKRAEKRKGGSSASGSSMQNFPRSFS